MTLLHRTLSVATVVFLLLSITVERSLAGSDLLPLKLAHMNSRVTAWLCVVISVLHCDSQTQKASSTAAVVFSVVALAVLASGAFTFQWMIV